MGPILIFDKSFLESLSRSEAIWLDGFFITNIIPTFYAETLADLEKESKKGKLARSGAAIVEEIVNKTPVVSSTPNVHYFSLVISDLFGHEVPIEHHQVVVSGGKYSMSQEGKTHVSFSEFPESAALQRWKNGDYLTVEREVAKHWRDIVDEIDHDSMLKRAMSESAEVEGLDTIEAVKEFVNKAISARHNQFLNFALFMLGVPSKYHKRIRQRWYETRRNNDTFHDFAPYAAFVLKISWFFYICVARGFLHLSHEKKFTNIVDLSYLYYLPFCSLFVSDDKIHRIIAPLFIQGDQTFVRGLEMKQALKKLNEYYSALPESIKKRGWINLSSYHPVAIETLISTLFDKHIGISWRKGAESFWRNIHKPMKSSKEMARKLKTEYEESLSTAMSAINSDHVNSMTLTRSVPRQRAGWNTLPQVD